MPDNIENHETEVSLFDERYNDGEAISKIVETLARDKGLNAKEILSGKTTHYVNIKLRFHIASLPIYGQLSIFYNIKEKAIDLYKSVISESSEAFRFSPFSEAKEYLKQVDSEAAQVPQNHQLAEDLESNLRLMFQVSENAKLTQAIKARSLMGIRTLVNKAIDQVFSDAHSELEIAWQSIKNIEYYKMLYALDMIQLPQQQESHEQPETGTSIDIDPVIDPVGGKPLASLKPGDRIKVKVSDYSDAALSFLERMQFETGMGDPILSVEVAGVEFDEQKSPVILIQLEPGLTGKIANQGNVSATLADGPSKVSRKVKKQQKKIDKKAKRKKDKVEPDKTAIDASKFKLMLSLATALFIGFLVMLAFLAG